MSGEELIKALRQIKKLAGHEARLNAAKQEIAERWSGVPPDAVGWRIESVEKMMPDSHKRETSMEIAVLLGEIEGRLMVDDSIRGRNYEKAPKNGGLATAELRRNEKLSRADEAGRIWDSLKTVSERNRAAIIAKRMNIESRTVREYLRLIGKTKAD